LIACSARSQLSGFRVREKMFCRAVSKSCRVLESVRTVGVT
jgi:hypothetical protein